MTLRSDSCLDFASIFCKSTDFAERWIIGFCLFHTVVSANFCSSSPGSKNNRAEFGVCVEQKSNKQTHSGIPAHFLLSVCMIWVCSEAPWFKRTGGAVAAASDTSSSIRGQRPFDISPVNIVDPGSWVTFPVVLWTSVQRQKTGLISCSLYM